jgi:hypothetical protein
MRIKSVCFVMILLMAGGCATYPNGSLEMMSTLPQHYAQFDVTMAWEVKASQGSTVITGVVKNIRYFEMSQLEIRASSLDDKGMEVHRAVDFVTTLRENESGAFTLKLPPLASGSRLRFMYSYIGSDGGGEFSALSWMQSFESVVP